MNIAWFGDAHVFLSIQWLHYFGIWLEKELHVKRKLKTHCEIL